MKERKGCFFYRGKFFYKEADFWDYVKAWPDKPVDFEELQRFLDDRMVEVKLNNDLKDGKLTNREAYHIINVETSLFSGDDVFGKVEDEIEESKEIGDEVISMFKEKEE